METRKIEIEVPDGKKAEWVNGVLTLVDEKDTRPVTERIKTLDDAIRELGDDNVLVSLYRDMAISVPDQKDEDADVVAYLQLRIIAAALNEGWKPEFKDDEYRWYPYFRLYTQDEIDDLDDEDKSRVVRRSGGHADAGGGSVCVRACDVASHAYGSHGARLSFKSDELALYAGKQFAEYYAKFIFAEPIPMKGE